MKQTAIRTFFACELSSDNLIKIDQLLDTLQSNLPRSIKWINAKNMHLTIKFIGEFNPSHLKQIQASLGEALQSFNPFNLEIQGMGAFPSLAIPKVIWLGINAGNGLNNLVNIVNNATIAAGYPPEKRPFSAHITLGRVKPYASQEDLSAISAVINSKKNIRIGSQVVSELHFIKSDLTPNGPIYKTLFKLPFSG